MVVNITQLLSEWSWLPVGPDPVKSHPHFRTFWYSTSIWPCPSEPPEHLCHISLDQNHFVYRKGWFIPPIIPITPISNSWLWTIAYKYLLVILPIGEINIHEPPYLNHSEPIINHHSYHSIHHFTSHFSRSSSLAIPRHAAPAAAPATLSPGWRSGEEGLAGARMKVVRVTVNDVNGLITVWWFNSGLTMVANVV